MGGSCWLGTQLERIESGGGELEKGLTGHFIGAATAKTCKSCLLKIQGSARPIRSSLHIFARELEEVSVSEFSVFK